MRIKDQIDDYFLGITEADLAEYELLVKVVKLKSQSIRGYAVRKMKKELL